MIENEPGAWVGMIADWTAAGLEMAGVLALLAGVVITTFLFLRTGLQRGAPGWAAAFIPYRANLGRAILLGLELLVAADIVHTVAAPLTFETVATLGLIVLIRTVLSLSLEVEIEGRWPWRRHGPETPENSVAQPRSVTPRSKSTEHPIRD
ncbi:DUF1622 domain-containing protein [Roseomonas frigidaquae]|uniref:DUF1622 domain-containing protein n=1 Tax=Falsiroseomonas frigidaquae TaxID=487318 RepID=A0ABX1EZ80_9PROT|nr:DUF1622 domain-containing protein [Falsiroseomonas frigidaquae]NKE45396.1 DUF1622 domain-containing protein [Falsiroseomonas frigidaquae]